MKVSVSEAGEVTMSDSKSQTNSLETDPIVEEVITFNPMELEARYDRAEFASVVFQNISEVYPIDAHIECKYTITADIVPTSRDWVALYKVGWMNPAKDYVYYEWAPMPKDYEIGKESEASILFPSHRLPGDDGEFYQFCYVSSTGQIRGASTPFQFRKPSAADYVEVDDPDTNMLVIQSRSVYLQENLQAAETQKNKLIQVQEMLVKELDQLANHLEETKEELSALQTENADLKNKLKQEQDQIVTLNKEASDMNLIQEEQRARIEYLLKEKKMLETRIGVLDGEMKALTSALMKYHAEKKDLEDQKRSLAEEVAMYQGYSESSEKAAMLYGEKLKELQVMIAEKDDALKHLQEDIEKLSQEMKIERECFNNQSINYIESMDKITCLEDQLRNTMNRLSAAEESRGLAARELETYKEIHARLTADIEKTKTDNHCLKTKVSDLEKDFQQRATIMKAELQETQADLKGALREKEYAEMQMSQIQNQLDSWHVNSPMSEVSMNSSMSAMKLALSQLKERLEKKEKQNRTLEKALSLREKEFTHCENNLRHEIDDLKEKIYMCGEEYKALLIEKTKAQRKLEKVTEMKKLKMQRAKSEEVQIERPQTSPVASTIKMFREFVFSISSPMKEKDAQNEKSNDEIEQCVDDLEQKMNVCAEKKEKYKELYKEEKVRNRELQLQMSEQLKEKDSEILNLRKKFQDMEAIWDCKLQSLEKCVIDKEDYIEMLNQKLRDCAKEKEALKASASCTSKVSAAASGSSDPSGTDCKYPFYNFHYPTSAFVYHLPPPPYQYLNQQSTHLQPLKYPDHGTTNGTPLEMPLPPLRYPDYSSAAEEHKEQAKTKSVTAQSPYATSPVFTPFVYPLQPLKLDTTSPVFPPLVYPGQPLKLDLSSAKLVEDKTLDTSQDDDEDYCDTLLMPLPPPLQPEVLPMARVPAVTATFNNNDPNRANMDDVRDDVREPMNLVKTVYCDAIPSAPPVHEDRFLDAPGEPMKLCPVCNKSFPMDVADLDFENHVMDHVEGICPICRMSKGENMSDDDFMRHVNKHYEDSDVN